MKTINVLIADDHPLFIEGIRAILAGEDNINIVAEANDGHQAIELVKKHKPDVVVMDITMPKMDGIEATKHIKELSPETKVVALSIHSGKQFVKDMLNAGASGYLLKDSAPDDLVNALQKIADGDMFLSSTITHIALMKDESENKEMPQNILYTKLHKPSITNDFVVRKEIIDNLEENKDKPFSLVSAPAGYGKSMMVSSWLDTTSGKGIWISLGDEDNELQVFLNYLHIAIENAIPGASPKLSLLIQSIELPSVRSISETLINELDKIDEFFILVLDDYHLIKDSKIHELMDALLRFPPQNMHLVIVCRRDPPLSLNTLRAHSRMNEIRMQDLSFKEGEVISLFKNMFEVDLSEKIIKQLLIKTEGWIVGLRLASLIIDKEENKERLLQNLEGDIYTISEFLLDEVLMKQPDEIHSLLLTTSVFNRFCADMIDEIQDKNSAENLPVMPGSEFIHWLINRNLFIISLDDQNKWFRYHHLFQELLQKLLIQKLTTEQISQLHQKASTWFEKQELIEEAIEHKLADGDELGAIKLIEKHAHHEFIKGVYRIRKWLDSVSEELRYGSPKIILIEAWQAFGQFQLEKIPVLLEKAETLLKGETIDAELKVEIDFFHGNFQYWTGETEASIKTLENALSHTENIAAHVYGNIELILNMAQQRVGRYETIIPKLLQELRGLDRSGGYQFSYTYGSLAFAHMLQGRLQQSLDSGMQWQNHTSKLKAHYFHAWSTYIQGGAYFHLCKLDEAMDHFKSTYEKRYILDLRMSIDTMAAMALIWHFKREPQKVKETIQAIIEFAEIYTDPQALLIAQSLSAHHAFLHGDIETAMVWANSFKEEINFAGIFFWLEVPWITRAKILVAHGSEESLEEAQALLSELIEVSVSSNLHIQIPDIKLAMALASHKQGEAEEGLKIFEEAVMLASREKIIRPFIEAGPEIKDMLQILRSKNPDMHFINSLIESIDHFNQAKPEKPEAEELKKKTDTNGIDDIESLTIRENEVLKHVAEGLRNKEIASKLYVSEITVKKHLSNIFKKVNVKNRITLINKAKENGLIDL